MADEIKTGEPKSGGRKTMLVLAAMFIVEAVVIVGAFMLAGSPPEVGAMTSAADIESAEDEKLREILVLDDRLPNNKSGVTYLYATEIYIQAKRRHQGRIEAELDQFENEIRSEINAIWKTSEPQHFQEPMLETLTRKIDAMFNRRFGADQETGERIVSKCVIVMGTGMRVDS